LTAGTAREIRRADEFSAGEMAASEFVHEFRNELSIVNSAAQIMEHELTRQRRAGDEPLAEAFGHIKSGIERLVRLMREFQGLERAERLNLRSADVTSVIKELLAIEAKDYVARGIRVQTLLPPNLPPVMLDVLKFRQALLNLCRNAAEAMPRGGVLTLRAYRTNSHVHVAVIDNGEGIPPGMDAFALFATTKPTGTGIGLPIAQQIIYRHGGTISYASEPGRGTIFRLALPVVVA
jgi:signal transduction histidine kinase